jgi:5-hydroxyisourate hydrolase-like protein (transthyretin family)
VDVDELNEPDDEVVVRGIVRKPDGSPAAGATVSSVAVVFADFERQLPEDFEPKLTEVTTDANGRFEVTVQKKPFGDLDFTSTRFDEYWKHATIAASLNGFGGDWIRFSDVKRPDELVLALVDDMPLRGRVVDLEGQPLAGVPVAIGGLSRSSTGDLSDWVNAIKAGENAQYAYRHASHSTDPELLGVPGNVVTDADGRFVIHGMGRERQVTLQIVGENVAFPQADALTREMAATRRIIFAEETQQVFGADFVFSAAPSQPVEGTVVDADTGKPLADVEVKADRFAGSMMSGLGHLKTSTDKDGRFRLLGLPKSQPDAKDSFRFNYLALRPNDDQPYLMRRIQVAVGQGLETIDMTIELHRGIWITGRVTNNVTGEPVSAVRMHYLPYRSNKYAIATPEFDDNGNADGNQTRYQTNENGEYRLVGLPGPAVIGAESIVEQFRYGVGYDALKLPEDRQASFRLFYRNPITPSRKWPNTMLRIDPRPDVENVTLDFQLDPGTSIQLRIVDQAGQPVVAAELRGLSSRHGAAITEAKSYTVTNLSPDTKRCVIVRHKDRNIGMVARIGTDDIKNGLMVVRLEKCVTVTGKLTDEGKPLSGVSIEPLVLPTEGFSQRLKAVTTDSEGRFTCTLLPGCEYRLLAEGNGDLFATVADDLTATPGEDIDFGTLTLKDRKFVSANQGGSPAITRSATSMPGEIPSPAESPSDSTSATADDSIKFIQGTVTDENGNAIPNAVVAVTGMKAVSHQRPDYELITEMLVGSDGKFRISLPPAISKSHRELSLIAMADKRGIHERGVNLKQAVATLDCRLFPEELIKVRLVDIDGQPAANLILAAGTPGNGTRHTGIKLQHRKDFGVYRTDENGLLTVMGLSSGQGLMLKVPGDEKFAPQRIALNTSMKEQRDEQDGTYRPLVKNVKRGETGTLALAPARIFEGVVLLGESGKPAVNAKIVVDSSQQKFGSSMSVEGMTDGEGRFRVNALPGIRFNIAAHPPTGMPYQIRQLRDLKWDSSERTKSMEIKLAEGVTATGIVVDAISKKPLVAACIQYIPDRVHNKNIVPGVVTGWQGIQKTDEQGRFQISVFAGPGTLLIHAPENGNYVLKETTSQVLEGGKGGRREYAHAIQRIDPVGGQTLDLDPVELKPGRRVRPHLTDEDGNKINEAFMVSRLKIWPHSPQWRGMGGSQLGGWELKGLEIGKK